MVTMHTYNQKVELINKLLPQTQCGQCGFKGCLPYAQALAQGAADINQCPPGGADGIAALATFLEVAVKPLNPAFGVHKPKHVAQIIEEQCIGCVKCINACPVDAILGASKVMHTVIASECTGCELCIAPCPVDCIIMLPLTEQPSQTERRAQAMLAQQRYEQRQQRKQREAEQKLARAQQQKAAIAKKSAAVNTSTCGKS